MVDLATSRQQLQLRLDELVSGSSTPGYVAGVWLDGQSFEIASGVANLNTGVRMTTDTAFLLGSISKVVVTSMLMRFVERGVLELDDPVARHLPEFRLAHAPTRDALTVRHLLNHSSGIDASDFAPELGRGEDAIRGYVAALGEIGQIYPVGAHISYCNPGFVIAGRLLEVVTGEAFDVVLKREILGPFGMTRTCTSGDEAILHRTAIGHIVEPATGVPRPTRRFMLPYSMAPAGSTIVTTVKDLLRYAGVHIDRGCTPEGARVLSAESVSEMQTPTIQDEGLLGLGVGLGWILPRYGKPRILTHGGGSYGGLSTLVVVPEKRFAYAGFGNSTTAAPIHARMSELALHAVVGLPPSPRLQPVEQVADLRCYVGSYVRQNTRIDIGPGENGALQATITSEYSDDGQRELHREYLGRDQLPPFPIVPVTETLFVPPGTPADSLTYANAYASGLAFVDPGPDGRYRYLSIGLRMARRVD